MITCAMVAFLMGCGDGYQQTEDGGVEYRIHEDAGNETGEKGDVIEMEVVYEQGDTAITNTYLKGEPVRMQLKEASYGGDIMAGLLKLGKGDSASFRLHADSVFGDFRPMYMDGHDYVNYYLRVLDIWNEEEKIETFIREENLDMNETESGLRYKFLEEGEGESPEQGKLVKAHFTGKLLNGEVFEERFSRENELYEGTAGYGQPVEGWDEMVLKMNEGDKAKAIVPSEMGFREGGDEMGVPAFSPLLFEIELVEVDTPDL